MKPKEKRTLERKQTYNRRRSDIIQAAKLVFYSNGIENTKMTDIADKAEMGVASVYRYFNTKPELVIETGIDYCREITKGFSVSKAYEGETGLVQIKELLEWLMRLISQKPEFVTFLQQFDFFFSLNDNRHPRLGDFEKEIQVLNSHWFKAMEKGVNDGSIRGDISIVDAVTLILRSFISLQQRNLTRDHILSIDEQFDRQIQLGMLKEMAVCYLTNRQ